MCIQPNNHTYKAFYGLFLLIPLFLPLIVFLLTASDIIALLHVWILEIVTFTLLSLDFLFFSLLIEYCI